MTSLIEIPSCSALHIPAPNAAPVPLSEGDLILTLIPANPPTHPSSTITLSIGTSSFPLLPISPLQKIQSTEEHSSYIFTPVPADGGAGVGRVKIVFKDSKSQAEWEASEALSSKFEEILKAHGLWDEKLLFVNDEFEKPAGSPRQGWGETFAGSLLGASQDIANRLQTYTDKHIATTNPTHPAPPSDTVKSTASTISSTTSTISNYAVTGSAKLSNLMQDVGKTIGSKLPDAVVQPIRPVPEGEKSDFRKIAEGGWTQVAAAAKGVVGAAVVVGGAVSGASHRAVEHNFGKEAEGVAQDVGQTGANVVTTGTAASAITAPTLHGINVGTGVYESQQKQ